MGIGLIGHKHKTPLDLPSPPTKGWQNNGSQHEIKETLRGVRGLLMRCDTKGVVRSNVTISATKRDFFVCKNYGNLKDFK